MTIRHIQIFVLIAKHLSFQKAARELNITPSSLSKQLKSLEDELAVQLFIRSPRSVTLTPAGQELLQYAQSLDSIYSDMRRELQQHANYRTRPLSVCTIHVTHSYRLSDMFASFAAANHAIRVEVAERPTEDILSGLDNLSVDVGIVFNETIPPDKYAAIPLYTDTISVLLNRKHPCAGEASLALAEIPHSRAIFMARDRSIYQLIHDQYAKIGSNSAIFDSDMRLITIGQYIKVMPDYITILPSRMAAGLEDADVVAIPLTDFKPVTLTMIKRKEPYSSSAQYFMESLTHFYKVNPQLSLL